MYIMHMYMEIHLHTRSIKEREKDNPDQQDMTRHIIHRQDTYIHVHTGWEHCRENWDVGLKSLLQLATLPHVQSIYNYMYEDNSLGVDSVLLPEECQLIPHYKIPSPGASNSTWYTFYTLLWSEHV